MPDPRVYLGYGIRSMPTTLTHVGPVGRWGIWLSRVLYTCRTSGAKQTPDHLHINVSRILYTLRPTPIRSGCRATGAKGSGLQL